MKKWGHVREIERERAKYPPPNWTCSNNQAEKGMGKKGVNGNTHGMRRRESILQNFQMLSPREREREETFIRKLENIRSYVLFCTWFRSVCVDPHRNAKGRNSPTHKGKCVITIARTFSVLSHALWAHVSSSLAGWDETAQVFSYFHSLALWITGFFFFLLLIVRTQAFILI